MVGSTTTPIIAANAGVGNGSATIVARSTDMSGNLTINCGTSGVGAGKQCTVTFDTAYAVAPIVVLTSTSSQVDNMPYVLSSTTSFSVYFRATPANGSGFAYNYIVVG